MYEDPWPEVQLLDSAWVVRGLSILMVTSFQSFNKTRWWWSTSAISIVVGTYHSKRKTPFDSGSGLGVRVDDGDSEVGWRDDEHSATLNGNGRKFRIYELVRVYKVEVEGGNAERTWNVTGQWNPAARVERSGWELHKETGARGYGSMSPEWMKHEIALTDAQRPGSRPWDETERLKEHAQLNKKAGPWERERECSPEIEQWKNICSTVEKQKEGLEEGIP
ncbi:hypothetical protein B0H11DRAFT_1933019 [Mycena galericulata]|nr:hypothetical protein B0H11DRAFT_1933019 [Mycena galericulata]